MDIEKSIEELSYGLWSYPHRVMSFPDKSMGPILHAWQIAETFVPYPDLLSILVRRYTEHLGVKNHAALTMQNTSASLIRYCNSSPLRKNYSTFNQWLATRYLQEQVSGVGSSKLERLHFYRFWGDFTNMGGLSQALSVVESEVLLNEVKTVDGVARADKYIAMVAQELLKVAHKDKVGRSGIFFREGADEIGGLFYSQAEIPDTCDVVNDIEAFSASLSVRLSIENIEHRKYPGDPVSSGSRFICEVVPVSDSFDVRSDNEKLEAKVKEKRNSWPVHRDADQMKLHLSDEELRSYDAFFENKHERNSDRTRSRSDGEAYSVPWIRLDKAVRLSKSMFPSHDQRQARQLFLGMCRAFSYDADLPIWRSEDLELSALKLSERPGEHYLITFEQLNFAGLNEKYGHAGCNLLFRELIETVIRFTAIANQEGLFDGRVSLYRPSDAIMMTGNKVAVLWENGKIESLIQFIRSIIGISGRFNYDRGLFDVYNNVKKYSGALLSAAFVQLPREMASGEILKILAGLFLEMERNETNNLLLNAQHIDAGSYSDFLTMAEVRSSYDWHILR